MADRAGFEPAETLLPHTLSKRARSTTLPPVLSSASWLKAAEISQQFVGWQFFF